MSRGDNQLAQIAGKQDSQESIARLLGDYFAVRTAATNVLQSEFQRTHLSGRERFDQGHR